MLESFSHEACKILLATIKSKKTVWQRVKLLKVHTYTLAKNAFILEHHGSFY